MIISERAEAIANAAKRLEHECEFNETESSRWPAAARAENNRRIGEAREMWDRYDAEVRGAK